MGDIAEKFDAGGWAFTPEVTAVFDDHVVASVPHYAVIQELVAQASDWFLPHGSTYADLGASTGTTAEVIARRHPARRIRAELYDEVPEMLDQAVSKLAPFENMLVQKRLQKLEANFGHHNADLTTALFTLQFLRPAQRVEVLTKAFERSSGTGALIVAEKIRPANPIWHELGIDLSHDVKEAAGLSDTAIRQKAKSLRGVLMPQSISTLMDEIDVAGWKHAETLFRWHQWVVVGALAS